MQAAWTTGACRSTTGASVSVLNNEAGNICRPQIQQTQAGSLPSSADNNNTKQRDSHQRHALQVQTHPDTMEDQSTALTVTVESLRQESYSLSYYVTVFTDVCSKTIIITSESNRENYNLWELVQDKEPPHDDSTVSSRDILLQRVAFSSMM